eukprot:476920-Prorocentrum_minimum.AAC.1
MRRLSNIVMRCRKPIPCAGTTRALGGYMGYFSISCGIRLSEVWADKHLAAPQQRFPIFTEAYDDVYLVAVCVARYIDVRACSSDTSP